MLNHPSASASTKRNIEKEINTIRSGVKGEKDAAYQIEYYYGNGKNWAVIHDLRIEHKGRVAQIDHLLINRLMEIWVCESKHFNQGISINEQGEFVSFFGAKAFGIPSPLEQNRRHCSLLQEVFDDGVVPLEKRLGFSIKPVIKSLVLVSGKARITRPAASFPGLDEIIKVDQIKAKLDKAIDDDNNPLNLAKLVSSETVKAFAERVVALHKPLQFNWPGKFGLPVRLDEEVAVEAVQNVEPEPKKSKLACNSCGTVVAYNVAKFCWFNKPRFGGQVYCYECQKNV
ncbi:nuclease-related domain-containing protein [Limnobacter sp.]|uniref:nuclease-related domain-containing protein n=1 Tax=Limnobacter sp. TaxID=2003368 RepID=UPI002732E69E|nr:nuclease-related domain-containing protein [Limnobacter sp.]MDP3270225.1 nuclease-related domain-containing protein [Limnobacter sp.]